MKKKPKKIGLYWLVHHGRLIEWCYNYEERRSFIKSRKPKKEGPIRLKYFQPAKGLPEDVRKAERNFKKAQEVFDKADIVATKAGNALDRAETRVDNALVRNKAKIEAVHGKKFPNCPWNGYRLIFSRKRKKRKS